MDISKAFEADTDGIYECDDLTFETAVICEDIDLDSLSDNLESLTTILTL